MRIGWRAYLCEQIAMRRTEHLSEAEIEKRMQGYFRWRFEEALAGLCASSEPLAEVLEEILLIADGTDPIINWRPPAIEEMLARLTQPLAYDARH
jgi:hypothetical protein